MTGDGDEDETGSGSGSGSGTGLTGRLAAFAAGLRFDDLSDREVRTAERAFVDTVGVLLAGLDESAARGIAGAPDAATPERRALATGTAAHALDYDDISWAMDGHPSVVLVPPVLALAGGGGDGSGDGGRAASAAAAPDPTGADAVAAYAAGYEVACAVGETVSPAHYERGWHPTATVGRFGAAAAAASLLGLDADRTRHALGIAASTAAGLKANFGSDTKPLHAGLAARDGVSAALLAAAGVDAGADPVGGDGGFGALYAGGFAAEPSIRSPRRLDEYGPQPKAYPCCYYAHAAIAAAGAIADRGRVAVPDIESVTVEASRAAADALQYPEPDTPTRAKFSMEYAVASALVDDRVDLSTFTDAALGDPDRRAMRDRVEFAVDESLPYAANGATVRATDGDAVDEATRAHPPGSHDDPLGADRLRRKFEDCATVRLDPAAAADLHDWLADLATRPGLDPVLDRIAGA